MIIVFTLAVMLTFGFRDCLIDLIGSKYFRAYAYTNQYEFFAVLLESFIETPLEFQARFPEFNNYMRQMLNFRFRGLLVIKKASIEAFFMIYFKLL